MKPEKTVIKIEIEAPVVTQNKFITITGISPSTVARMIKSGFLSTIQPTNKERSLRLINMVDLATRAAAESMTIVEFIKNRNRK